MVRSHCKGHQLPFRVSLPFTFRIEISRSKAVIVIPTNFESEPEAFIIKLFVALKSSSRIYEILIIVCNNPSNVLSIFFLKPNFLFMINLVEKRVLSKLRGKMEEKSRHKKKQVSKIFIVEKFLVGKLDCNILF